MPSTDTIASTDIVQAVSGQKIKSSEWNSTIDVFRGNLLPVTTSTSTASNLTYNIGAYDYSWLRIHGQEFTFNDLESAPSNPTAGFYKLYFKTDGNLYKLNSSGDESQVDAASSSFSTKSTSGAYTVTTSDDLVILNASSGAFTVTLPTATAATKPVIIKKNTGDSSFNAVTIDGNGSDTIDGTLTTSINTIGELVKLAPDGSGWQIVERHIPSNLGLITTTATWSTNVTITARYWREKQYLSADVFINISGGVTTAALFVNLPTGLNANTVVMIAGTATSQIVGICHLLDSGARKDGAWCGFGATTTVQPFWGIGSGANGITSTNPYTWANGDAINVKYKVPISGWED